MALALVDRGSAVRIAPHTLPTLDQALARDKREGLELAVQSRWSALSVVALLLVYLRPSWDVLYYHAILAGFALIAWAHLKLGRVGRNPAELALLVCDVVLMAYVLVVPNPFRTDVWPAAMQFRFGGFSFFYLLLATAVLSYSWRTILVLAGAIVLAWLAGLLWVWLQPVTHPEISERVAAALADHPTIAEALNPYAVLLPLRIEEMTILVLVAATLAIASWRSHRLMRGQAEMERERSNLARYFSPNVVETLAQNDAPVREIRSQNVAVLFVDIVGFRSFADRNEPAAVVQTLRTFLERMEREVFRHGGTLDKYLGDGLMATFGTPVAGDRDALEALRCGRAMLAAADALNTERARRGAEPLAVGVGVHYGPVVTGDIGVNRLELAVIGATVNIANRLEAHTRVLNVRLVASRDVVERARGEPGWSTTDEDGLDAADPQMIRGVAEPVRTYVVGG